MQLNTIKPKVEYYAGHAKTSQLVRTRTYGNQSKQASMCGHAQATNTVKLNQWHTQITKSHMFTNQHHHNIY